MARRRLEPVNNNSKKKKNRSIIMIDDEWGLEFETMNIVVIRKRPNKKGILFIYPLSYHGTLEGAVFRMYRLMIEENVKGIPIRTIEGLKHELHTVGNRLINSLAKLKDIENGKETDTETDTAA
jgi:hypothetical protein